MLVVEGGRAYKLPAGVSICVSCYASARRKNPSRSKKGFCNYGRLSGLQQDSRANDDQQDVGRRLPIKPAVGVKLMKV